MPEVGFFQPNKARELYEVFLGSRMIGIVWEAQGQWYADPASTADPLVIHCLSRDAAAEALVAEIGAASDGQPEEKAIRDASPD